MKKCIHTTHWVVCILFAGLVVQNTAEADSIDRWYHPSRVELGEKVYTDNCAMCHGQRAEATPEWMKQDPDGFFPPPPLNGTAHTWHHPFQELASKIKFGGVGGKMPSFTDKLTDEQIVNVLAWIQSLWPDEIYTAWWRIQQRAMQQQ